MELPRSSRRATSVGPYLLGEEIGKGAAGQVYKAIDRRTGAVVAIKEIPSRGLDAAARAAIAGEIELLSDLRHPNVVRYLGTVASAGFEYIVLELAENGSLAANLKPGRFGPCPESLAAVYVAQMLDGLAYLHERGVVHRDIKGANVLTTKAGVVKLADFGVAERLKAGASAARARAGAEANVETNGSSSSVGDETLGETFASSDVRGTPYWMAPEVIEMGGATFASDVWSVGCTAVELLTGAPPYFDHQPMPAMFAIVRDKRPPLPSGISDAMRDFLKRCFRKDPKARPGAAEMRAHEWVRDVPRREDRTGDGDRTGAGDRGALDLHVGTDDREGRGGAFEPAASEKMPSSTPPIDPRDVAIEERRLSGRAESARVSSSAPGGSRVSDSDSDSDEWSPPEALADAAAGHRRRRPPRPIPPSSPFQDAPALSAAETASAFADGAKRGALARSRSRAKPVATKNEDDARARPGPNAKAEDPIGGFDPSASRRAEKDPSSSDPEKSSRTPDPEKYAAFASRLAALASAFRAGDAAAGASAASLLEAASRERTPAEVDAAASSADLCAAAVDALFARASEPRRRRRRRRRSPRARSGARSAARTARVSSPRISASRAASRRRFEPAKPSAPRLRLRLRRVDPRVDPRRPPSLKAPTTFASRRWSR